MPLVVTGILPSAAVEIVLTDGTTVRVAAGCERETVSLVLAALGDHCRDAASGPRSAASDAVGNADGRRREGPSC